MAQQLIATVPGGRALGPTDLVSPPGTRYCTRTWYLVQYWYHTVQYSTSTIQQRFTVVDLAVIIFDIYIYGAICHMYIVLPYFPHTLSTTAVFCYVLCSV